MRYAIVSDIHANWQAWNATLLDIRSSKVDQIICLGDLIGYGPNPAEVFQSVHANVDHLVLGNHDAVLVGMMDAALFNDKARSIIEWTATRLNEEARAFLQQLPLCLAGDGFRCTHGDFAEPGAFNYIIEPADAGPSLRQTEEPLLFVGHTHCPGVFVLRADGCVEDGAPEDFTCQPGERYLVNVGSVGQPRDKEARASYVIFDTETLRVSWRRIPFDIDAYRAAVRTAGIAEEASHFLVHDPRQGRAPLREILNFSPPRSPEQGAHSLVEVRDIKALRRSMRMWKIAALAVITAMLLAAGITGGVWWKNRSHDRVIADPRGMRVEGVTAPAEFNLFPKLMPSDQENSPMPGWTIRLGEKESQGVRVLAAADPAKQPPLPGPVLAMRSQAAESEIRLSSALILVKPGMRLEMEGLFLKSKDFSGQVQFVVLPFASASSSATEVEPLPLTTQTPNSPRRNGWFLAKRTFTVPPKTGAIRVDIRGSFSGEVLCQGLELRVKPATATGRASTEPKP